MSDTKLATKVKRQGPSQSELLKGMLGGSKQGLSNHRDSASAVAKALNNGHAARKVGQVSANSARSDYNKAVGAVGSIGDSAARLTQARNDMEKSAIQTRALKRKMTNIVRQFTADASHSGVEISDLQKRIGGYIKNNTADILEVIQQERESSFNTLASVRLRKGIKGGLDKLGIPVNRLTTLASSLVAGVFGYQVGKGI